MLWEFFRSYKTIILLWFVLIYKQDIHFYIVLRSMAYLQSTWLDCAILVSSKWRWCTVLHPQGGSTTCFRLSLLPYSGFFIINCLTRLIQAQCDVLELSEIKEIVVSSVPRTTDPPRTCLIILTWSYQKLLILDTLTLLNQLSSCKRRWRLIKTGQSSSWSNPLGHLS